MATILVVFHTQSGNTHKLAQACAQGAKETEGITVLLKQAKETLTEDIKNSSAIILCSPEYFGYMAGAIKDLFDRTYDALKDDVRVYKKPYAVVISAGNDGTGALSHIERICKGYRFKKVQNPIVCKGKVTEEMLEKCYELGRTIAEGVKAGIF
ncbi:MAG TPA: NAD(P)H-dependent oxidoreductase [Syntrophorhabdaceae bacterium]|nr:NAD(P)H-dependent oxidoreductase [Syntrophorhabdaceae bacterium]HOL06588.1 NAD(P)H-dependent oxidoreductase [Syntrophorhabdaceae bacterium]HON86453.1 NAD(P)H-dependent oxidoreductase [Syntrophorhabdaceae bacterium]HOT42830.1 NAD(P)H-dependent oxidoreductase [Syntrophorhabdaceae bacterium]HPP42911.1 NAD(P)H-dependent oxidoreductase [Syntrophorhabdaceae bacterium]